MAETEPNSVIADTAAPHRRARVREVSSRFMSPVSSSSCDHKHHRQEDNKDAESVSSSDENRPIETARSFESPFQRRQKPQPMKLFNDNGRYRPDTPNPIVSNSSSSSRPRAATAATKLLHSISPQDDTSSNVDMLPTRNINRVNLQLSTCQNGFYSSIKGCEKLKPALSRSFSNSTKIGGKGRKVSGQQEDPHSIKLLHNHYLQWRFANAKAEASIQALRRETKKSLYSLGVKISELYDSVKRKRIELEILKRTKTLSTILEAQMPYLDEWCAFEEDYSSSLSEATQALLNASIQLPIGGHVRADVREVGEALNSAAKLMGIIILHLQSFVPKAEEVEILISELAKVTGGERALVEECGVLLSKTHTFQVEECSLRGQLMQLHQRLAVFDQLQQEINNSSSLNAVHMR